MRKIVRSLANKNFRLLFFGQTLSITGTWMQNIALSWLVYRLTGSALLLGIVGFAGQIPLSIISPFAGVVIDRSNKHKIILLTQVLSMLQAILLALLFFSGTLSIQLIIFLSAFLGLINAFDMTARQAFVSEIVENKHDLGNAIALNSSLVHVARLIGPSLAGIIIAAWGEGFCFLINAVSYLAVLFSLLMMRIIPKKKKPSANLLLELKEGLAYAARSHPIRSLLLFMALMSTIGMSYTIIMPVFAKEVLRGGPQLLGFLMGITGLGAVIGSIYLASRKSAVGLDRIIGLAAVGMGIGLFFLAFAKTLLLSSVLIVLIGFAMMVLMSSGNTILQMIVDEDKRGRIMSLFITAFMGTAPLGSLLAGLIAGRFGVPVTFFASGLICLVGSAVFFLSFPKLAVEIKTIYKKLGILMEEGV